MSAQHLAWWCLQFTPRVALLEDAVVLEVQASERLFGGTEALHARLTQAAMGLGVRAWACADTALAAVALARSPASSLTASPACSHSPGTTPPADPAAVLDPLPLTVLPGVASQAPTLARLGCRTLADVRALPRGGLSRRFGAPFLATLDQAYGLRPEAFDWLTLPEVFDARLSLPGRIETTAALLCAAQHLLQQLCAWLAGRQAGVQAFTLRWLHDWQRRDASREGALTLRLASPSRELPRLVRLLAEHLRHTRLSAPVGDIGLHADAIEALPLHSQALFQEHSLEHLSAGPDALLTPAAQRAQRDALLALLDTLGARLGPERVLQARIRPDHRLECAQHWQPAVAALAAMGTRPPAPMAVDDLPQPCWVLAEPMPLALGKVAGQRELPLYQGPLKLMAGPHRVDAGWWDANTGHARVTRDYYLASSAHAGLLWIFKAAQAPDDTRSPWYLHGFFA